MYVMAVIFSLKLHSLQLQKKPYQAEAREKYFNNRLAMLMMLQSWQNAYRDSILTTFIEWDDG